MDTIRFYRVNEVYGCFSNFSKHPVYINNRMWRTTEHFFQAQKFVDIKIQSEILTIESPMEAANFGRRKDLPLRSDWEVIKDDVMRKAVESKIRQHSDVRELLLSTGNNQIVESTKNDYYWGDGGDGTGKNMLGIILMELRDQYRNYNDLEHKMNPPWIQYPEIKRRSIGWRMGYGEDYLDRWSPWFNGLSSISRETYTKEFPEPEEWKGYFIESKY